LNSTTSDVIPTSRLQELNQLKDSVSRIINVLLSKQQEIEDKIKAKYSKMAEQLKRKTTGIVSKK